MELWICESDIPKPLRKQMRILASKNPAKFRNKLQIPAQIDCKDETFEKSKENGDAGFDKIDQYSEIFETKF